MKLPTTNGSSSATMFPVIVSNASTVAAPRNINRLISMLAAIAFFLVKPASSSTPKSPTSFGTLCAATAIVDAIPADVAAKKEVVISIPSSMLCTPSPASKT